MGDNNSNEPRKSVWPYVLIAVIVIGFGVPLLRFLDDVLSSSSVSIIALLLLAVLLYTVLKKKGTKTALITDEIQTCSDIRNLDIRLGAGRYVLKQGDSFKIDGGNVQSRIEKGTWYVLRDIANGISDVPQIITITVPSFFTADNALVKLGAGELLIKGLSAYDMTLEVAAGNTEAVGLYAKKLCIKCGVGRIQADASMHGDVDISCGLGEAAVTFTNRAEEFNYSASVGLGKVVVGGSEVNGAAQTTLNSPYNMNIRCGMGSVKVDFGGVADE